MAGAWPFDEYDMATWEESSRLLPHLLVVVNLAADYMVQSQTVVYLNSQLGFYLHYHGDLAGARPYYERDLVICEKALGPDHPDTAQSLNNLGALLDSMGDLAGARPYYERALAITEKALGPDHPDTAHSLNNLAILHYYEGDLVRAARLMRRALAIYEARLGVQHPDTVSSRESLAVIEATLERSALEEE
ncbi:MAG TPA: tetratricopeptide repeat protein [Anaerolineae bacterium]